MAKGAGATFLGNLLLTISDLKPLMHLYDGQQCGGKTLRLL